MLQVAVRPVHYPVGEKREQWRGRRMGQNWAVKKLSQCMAIGCVAVGAIGLAQFPYFFQQYMQRLEGGLSQMRITLVENTLSVGCVLKKWNSTPWAEGISLDRFIQKYLPQDSKLSFHDLVHKYLPGYVQEYLAGGGFDREIFAAEWQQRLLKEGIYTEAQGALSHATILTKPLLWARYSDLQLARETYFSRTFSFGLPFTIEALLYALVGALLGYLFYLVICKIVLLAATCFGRQPRLE